MLNDHTVMLVVLSNDVLYTSDLSMSCHGEHMRCVPVSTLSVEDNNIGVVNIANQVEHQPEALPGSCWTRASAIGV